METKIYKNDVYLIPKELDETFARLLLPAFGAYLTQLTHAQFELLGISASGPSCRNGNAGMAPVCGCDFDVDFDECLRHIRAVFLVRHPFSCFWL